MFKLFLAWITAAESFYTVVQTNMSASQMNFVKNLISVKAPDFDSKLSEGISTLWYSLIGEARSINDVIIDVMYSWREKLGPLLLPFFIISYSCFEERREQKHGAGND